MFEWLKNIGKNSMKQRENTESASSTGGQSVVTYYSDDIPAFVGKRTDLCISAVYRCVDLLSKSVANLPMQVMRRKQGLFVEDTDSRLSYLLNVAPNEWQSAYDFWCGVVQQMLLCGNAYIIPYYGADELQRLILCSPHSVSHDIYLDRYTINDSINGISGVLEQSEIIHIKNISMNGRDGVSVLAFARITLSTALQGDEETLTRFKNGGNVRGIISNDTSTRGFGEYQDNQLADLADKVDNKINVDGHRIIGMAGQVEFKQLSLSSVDMQFLESRKFTVREICRFFGVHPSFVFDDTSNNYKSAEMANVAFLSNTLNPILKKIENELLRKLATPDQANKRRFCFNREELYSCDLESKANYQQKTIANGTMTVNEWRAKENKPSVEGGDKVFLSANLKSIDEFSANTTNANANGNE